MVGIPYTCLGKIIIIIKTHVSDNDNTGNAKCNDWISKRVKGHFSYHEDCTVLPTVKHSSNPEQ
jgi:hypothetical protein